jgi:hypothetical protein
MGRPEKYTPEICDKMMEYFDQPLYVMEERQSASAGRKVITHERVANSMPTFEGFAVDNDLAPNTLLNWCVKYPDFLRTYNACKAIQKKFIIEHGMKGNYNAAFAKFIAVNVTDLRDRQEHDLSDDAKKALSLSYKLE